MATASLALLKKKAAAPAAEENDTPEVAEEPVPETVVGTSTPVEEAAAPEAAEAAGEATEDTPIEIENMTIPELDQLVKDNEVEVPETWWKQVNGVKKMTGPEKKAWLNEKFGTDSEEAAPETAPAEPVAEAAPAKAEKAVPAAKPEPTTKAAKAASKEMTTVKPAKTGEVVEPDEIADMVHEIENLKEKDARKLAAELNEQAEFTFFKLGGVLSVIQANNWFAPFASFREYVETEHGLHYRKAMYWVAIYNDMTAAALPWKKVSHLGWTKLSVLSPILNADNLDEWVKIAEQNNMSTLTELVRAAKQAATGQTTQISGPDNAVTVVTKTFKLHEDQKKTVDAALEKAKEAATTDVDTVALEFICLDYLGSKKPKPKTLTEQLQGAGIDAALEALNAAFPNTDFSVEVQS